MSSGTFLQRWYIAVEMQEYFSFELLLSTVEIIETRLKSSSWILEKKHFVLIQSTVAC